MNYPMYGNNQFYMNDLQQMRDRIDRQMQQMQQQNQYQMQPPTPITQNFQLAPNQNNVSEIEGKYAENIEEVKNTLVLKNTLFVNKDMNILWLKNAGGDIKKYSLIEVVELDPKDKEIAELKQQVIAMQEMINKNNSNENKIEKKNTKKEE